MANDIVGEREVIVLFSPDTFPIGITPGSIVCLPCFRVNWYAGSRYAQQSSVSRQATDMDMAAVQLIRPRFGPPNCLQDHSDLPVGITIDVKEPKGTKMNWFAENIGRSSATCWRVKLPVLLNK